MALAPPQPDTPRTTKRGTPCAGNWNKKWVRRVQRRETELGRRICGARSADGTPCLLPSGHPSGRCPNHGGFPNTGAPEGNRNAVIHGLYSRRITDCGIDGPVELEEYLAVTSAVEHRTAAHADNPLGHHLAHSIGLVTVMLNRAARAMVKKPLTDTVEQTGDTYRMSTEKVAAALTAFQILAREQRQWMRHLERTYPPQARIDSQPAPTTPQEESPEEAPHKPLHPHPEDSRDSDTPSHDGKDDIVDDDDTLYDGFTADDLGEDWIQLKKDMAAYEKSREARNCQHTNPSPTSAPGAPSPAIPLSPAHARPTPFPTPMNSASPSHDLNQLRASFIGKLNAIRANEPQPGPAPNRVVYETCVTS